MRLQVSHFSPYKEITGQREHFHPNSVFPMCFRNVVQVNFLAFAWSLLELLHIATVPINWCITQVEPLATLWGKQRLSWKDFLFLLINTWFLLVIPTFTALHCSITAKELCGHWSHVIYIAKNSSFIFCEHHRLWLLPYSGQYAYDQNLQQLKLSFFFFFKFFFFFDFCCK